MSDPYKPILERLDAATQEARLLADAAREIRRLRNFLGAAASRFENLRDRLPEGEVKDIVAFHAKEVRWWLRMGGL